MTAEDNTIVRMRWKALCNFAQGNYKKLPVVYQAIIQTIPQQTLTNTSLVFMQLCDFCLFMKGKIDTICSVDLLKIRHYLDIQENNHNPIMATPLTVVQMPTGMDHRSSMIHMRMQPDSGHGNRPFGQVTSATLIGSTTQNVPLPYFNQGSLQMTGYDRLDPATNSAAPSLSQTLANETDQWSYSRPVLDPSMVRTSFNPPIWHHRITSGNDGNFYSSWQSPVDPNTVWSTPMTMSGQPYGGYYPAYSCIRHTTTTTTCPVRLQWYSGNRNHIILLYLDHFPTRCLDIMVHTKRHLVHQ
jgi:hypothetical protein